MSRRQAGAGGGDGGSAGGAQWKRPLERRFAALVIQASEVQRRQFAFEQFPSHAYHLPLEAGK